eukprot:5004434-Prymnesium_polylepis.1
MYMRFCKEKKEEFVAEAMRRWKSGRWWTKVAGEAWAVSPLNPKIQTAAGGEGGEGGEGGGEPMNTDEGGEG